MILQKCLSVIKMQGTLLEDCAAKFYQKYSRTNIQNFGSIYFFITQLNCCPSKV